MNILGISAFYHDSAACLTSNGKIICAVQEERFSRIKHDASFPEKSIKWILEYSGLTLNKMDAIVFYDKPWLKFERILETYYATAPKGFKSFKASVPIWIKEKIFLKNILKQNLKKIDENFLNSKSKILFCEHHLSHAASTYYPSGFEESGIITIDGVGEWTTTSIAYGKENKIKILKELYFPHSIGLLYSSFTYFLGFKVNSGEYKLMGLAPYGNSNSNEYQVFKNKIYNHLLKVFDDGSIWLNQDFFDYMNGLEMIKTKKWEALFGIKKRTDDEPIAQSHCNLALAIQNITEDIIIKIAKETKRITKCDNLCLAGGVALNCVANGKLHDMGIFKNIFITPAAGDAGGSLGACLAAHHIYFNQKPDVSQVDPLFGSQLGPSFDFTEIEKVIRKYNAKFTKHSDEELMQITAREIANGKVVGWFCGRMEFGPRALGNRSILADPTNKEMQKQLNLKIKFRESFRPFAASVLEEDANLFFDLNDKSPFMLLVKKFKKHLHLPLPENYNELPINEKLYTPRSKFQSITHVDFSCRIQTVSKETNLKFYNLLQEFKKITGYGIIINTSFNVRGEPIVCNPEEAYICFMRTNMDILILENYMLRKSEQPEWIENDNWKKILKSD